MNPWTLASAVLMRSVVVRTCGLRDRLRPRACLWRGDFAVRLGSLHRGACAT